MIKRRPEFVQSTHLLVSNMKTTVAKANFYGRLHLQLAKLKLPKNFIELPTPRTRTLHRFHDKKSTKIKRGWKQLKRRRRMWQGLRALIDLHHYAGVKKYYLAAVKIQKIIRGRLEKKRVASLPRHLVKDDNVYALKERWVLLDKDECDDAVNIADLNRMKETYFASLHRLQLSINVVKDKLAQCQIEQAEVDKVKAQVELKPTNKVKFVVSKIAGDGDVYVPYTELSKILETERNSLKSRSVKLETEMKKLLSDNPLPEFSARIIHKWWKNLRFRRLVKIVAIYHQRHREKLVESNAGYYNRSTQNAHMILMILRNKTATIVNNWWRVQMAKAETTRRREYRSANTIKRFFQSQVSIILAKDHLRRLRRERIATEKFKRVIWRIMPTCWNAWAVDFIKSARTHKRLLSQLLRRGEILLVNNEAKKIQALGKKLIYNDRECMWKDLIESPLHPALRSRIENFHSDGLDVSYFFTQLHADYNVRFNASSHELTCASRYALPLSTFPFDSYKRWLYQQSTSSLNSSRVWVPGLTIAKRGIHFLRIANVHYWNATTLEKQLERVHEMNTTVTWVKSYLMHLLQCNPSVIVPSSATAALDHSRVFTALENKRQYFAMDAGTGSTNHWSSTKRPSTDSRVEHDTTDIWFSKYHSTFDTLCSECYSLLIDSRDRTIASICASCGKPRLQRENLSTAFRNKKPSRQQHVAPNVTNVLAQFNEPSDFIMIHAFFHALSPPGHANRLLDPSEVWSMALQESASCVRQLHDRSASTLDLLMLLWENNDKSLKESSLRLPQVVLVKLDTMLSLLYGEIETLLRVKRPVTSGASVL